MYCGSHTGTMPAGEHSLCFTVCLYGMTRSYDAQETHRCVKHVGMDTLWLLTVLLDIVSGLCCAVYFTQVCSTYPPVGSSRQLRNIKAEQYSHE